MTSQLHYEFIAAGNACIDFYNVKPPEDPLVLDDSGVGVGERQFPAATVDGSTEHTHAQECL